MSEHERMPLEQMFSIQQMVAAMTRTTCENECGNCNVCHLSIALEYEKFMRRGDVKHINACLEASVRKVKSLKGELDARDAAIEWMWAQLNEVTNVPPPTSYREAVQRCGGVDGALPPRALPRGEAVSNKCPGGMHDKSPHVVCCDECWARVPTRLPGKSRPWRTDLRIARAIHSWRQIEDIITTVHDWLTEHPEAKP
jgi:hypothetical protein